MHIDRSNQSAGLTASTPDPEYVLYRLEEAGRTLLALPNKGPSTQLRTTRHDVVQSAVEVYGWTRVDARLRPAMPSAAQVTRMDEALDWIRIIPIDRYVLRRIVGARALVSPITERHLFSWRRLGTLLGADHKAIQRWHGQGIDLIVGSLQGAVIASATSAAASPWPRPHPECRALSRPGGRDR
jgi:hypothetical protein